MRGFWEDDSNGPALSISNSLHKARQSNKDSKTKDPQTTSTTKPGDKASNESRWKQTSGNFKTCTVRAPVREDVWEGTRASEAGAQKTSASQATAEAQWTAWGPV